MSIELANEVGFEIQRVERQFYTTSSCGICGKASIEAVEVFPDTEISSDIKIGSQIIQDLPGRLSSVQDVFRETGGLHAAALFEPDGTLRFLEFNQLHTLNPANAAILSTVNLPFGGHDGLGIRPSDGVLFASRTGAGSLGDEIRIIFEDVRFFQFIRDRFFGHFCGRYFFLFLTPFSLYLFDNLGRSFDERLGSLLAYALDASERLGGSLSQALSRTDIGINKPVADFGADSVDIGNGNQQLGIPFLLLIVLSFGENVYFPSGQLCSQTYIFT